MYHELFDQSIEEYNSHQTRKDRKIKNYYNNIYNSKKHKTYQEMVIQVGDMEHHPDDEICKAIYHDYAERFQQRYPQMKVIGAYIHLDEETPHMHFEYIPWATYEGKKQHIQISNNRAIQQMGFKNWQEWFADQQQMLVNIMIDHGIEYVDMHNTNRKEDIYVYKEKVKQATKEIQNLESVTAPNFKIPQPEDPFTKKSLTGKETLTIEEHNRIMNQYVDSLNSYVNSLKNNYNNLL
ncbi:MAG: plasmid recombination protein [Erysipelotrichaceae bacterium]|nr:plasmid recombination protein [Erysipelotrichaceae bacterium]